MTTQIRIAAARHPHRTLHRMAPRDAGRLASEAERLREENAQLRRALESRAAVDQALGMVMALTPCERATAWTVLVETSQHTNTKLRTVASALVATTDGDTTLPAPVAETLAAAMHRARPRPRP